MSFRARKIENADSIIPKKYPKGFLKIITDALIDECCLKISIDNLLFDEKKRSHFTSAYILYNKSDSVYIMKNIKNIITAAAWISYINKIETVISFNNSEFKSIKIFYNANNNNIEVKMNSSTYMMYSYMINGKRKNEYLDLNNTTRGLAKSFKHFVMWNLDLDDTYDNIKNKAKHIAIGYTKGNKNYTITSRNALIGLFIGCYNAYEDFTIVFHVQIEDDEDSIISKFNMIYDQGKFIRL